MADDAPGDTSESVPDPTRVRDLLLARALTLSTAESLTGGDLSAALTTPPGASAFFLGGVVTYATPAKTALLGVSLETVGRHGAVSAQCATQMAQGARRLFSADLALSTTGIAGPDPQEGKPVGLAYVALAEGNGVRVEQVQTSGTRAEIRREVVDTALRLLVATLLGNPARGIGAGE